MRRKTASASAWPRPFVLLAWTVLATGLLAGRSLADVSVSPTVLVFDGEAGTKAVTVKNTGAKEQVYRVSLHNFRMLPDGHMVSADNPREDEHFATGMVRYSPRELVLAPGGSEVVRFQVAALRPGEYRTHVLVQQVPDVDALQAPPFQRGDGVSMDLQAVFGVAIPLILRQGELPTAVTFGSARLTAMPDGTPAVALRLERSGARSVSGALSLLRDGKEVGMWDGINVYAPAAYRDLLLAVDAKAIAALRDGSLEAAFHEPEDTRDPVATTAVVELH
jgi:hypothetical protein